MVGPHLNPGQFLVLFTNYSGGMKIHTPQSEGLPVRHKFFSRFFRSLFRVSFFGSLFSISLFSGIFIAGIIFCKRVKDAVGIDELIKRCHQFAYFVIGHNINF